ncbi:phosphatidylserine synthase [Tribonema minus]|uniref:Phosphatidylserine synthase n=1 Tax=Tribonema minus TaxID=303371 RepID=A0A836CG66_9STRA|nr:phosphatidylserine synthase [Tribonema minus]
MQLRKRRGSTESAALTSANAVPYSTNEAADGEGGLAHAKGRARDGSDSCGGEDSSEEEFGRNNMFRSNTDFIEEPRQIVTLMAMVAVAGYLGFRQDDADRDTGTRAALAGVTFIFLAHCFLQCRDTLFVRPHPGVWRVVHGLGMVYLLGVAVLLFHTRAEARRLLSVVFTDMESAAAAPGGADGAAPASAAEEMDCTLSWGAVLGQLREVWFAAHVAGWWGKMCLFRDWHVCWALSAGFELVELSMGWLIPQFRECWWDSVFIDFFGANLIGMGLGLATLRFLENQDYDWKKGEKGEGRGKGAARRGSDAARGLLQRAVLQFSPFSWRKWEWGTFTTFKRFCQILGIVIVTLATELNAFMMLNALDVPKTSMYNVVRLAIIFLVGLPAVSEYYEYITNARCSRLGQNAWLMLAIFQVETLTWIKFMPQSLLDAEYPPEVRLPHAATACMLALWALLAYTTHKQARSHHHHGHGGSSVSGGGAFRHHVRRQSSGGSGGGTPQLRAGGSGSGAAAAAEAEGAEERLMPARSRSFSDVVRGHLQLGGPDAAQRRALDVLLVAALLPLALLFKQWYT